MIVYHALNVDLYLGNVGATGSNIFVMKQLSGEKRSIDWMEKANVMNAICLTKSFRTFKISSHDHIVSIQ